MSRKSTNGEIKINKKNVQKSGRILAALTLLEPSRRTVAAMLDPLSSHLLFRPTDSEIVLSTMC